MTKPLDSTLQLDFSWLAQKPQEQVIACDIDCYKFFAALRAHSADSYYFESLALPRHQDRYYTMGFDPELIFAARGNHLSIRGNTIRLASTLGTHALVRAEINAQGIAKMDYHLANPYLFLKQQYKCTCFAGSHYSGLVGYFSYEAVNYFEPGLQLPEHPDFRTFQFGLYSDGLIYDMTTATLTYYTFAEDRSAFVRDLCRNIDKTHIPRKLSAVAFQGHSCDKAQFTAAVARTQKKIKTGYSFQAEVGFKSYYRIKGDKLAIYSHLREVNPGPYMYYLKFGQEELFGASPEILISNKSGSLLTTPTAGTIARGQTAAEDIRLARQLLRDPKEIAEHHMLVDLHRNDLARVAVPGSVKIADLMYIIRFSHVQHIVSNVVGLLQPSKTAFDALAAIFPGGVVTGAPKIETIKIIHENEQQPRGPYGGAVGRFALNGDCEFCLPIRSIFCYGDQAYIQTSAGIVHDSVPEKEYQEVQNKLAAMRQVLQDLSEGI